MRLFSLDSRKNNIFYHKQLPSLNSTMRHLSWAHYIMIFHIFFLFSCRFLLSHSHPRRISIPYLFKNILHKYDASPLFLFFFTARPFRRVFFNFLWIFVIRLWGEYERRRKRKIIVRIRDIGTKDYTFIFFITLPKFLSLSLSIHKAI